MIKNRSLDKSGRKQTLWVSETCKVLKLTQGKQDVSTDTTVVGETETALGIEADILL